MQKDIDLMVWDLETTGFVAPECKILEIGCYIFRGVTLEKRHWVLNNNVEIPERITEITGITKEIIEAEGRDPKECLNEFLPLFKNCKVNVTHNGVRFDIPFLLESATALFGYTPQEKLAVKNLLRSTAFDTSAHFKAKKLGLEPDTGETYLNFVERIMNIKALGVKHSLGTCVEELGIVHNLVQHRAMADVELTYQVYNKICNTI